MALLNLTMCLLAVGVGLRMAWFSIRQGIIERRIRNPSTGSLVNGRRAVVLGTALVLAALIPILGGIAGLCTLARMFVVR